MCPCLHYPAVKGNFQLLGVPPSDLIEEVARLVGYDQFTPRRPRAVAGRALAPEGTLALDRARDQLVDRGYCEVVTYSFVDPDLQVLVSPGTPAINLRNPIATQFAQMRLTLLPGLIERHCG